MSERTASGPRTGAWGQFWDAVEKSQHYRLWEAMRSGSAGPSLRQHAEYMLFRRELFARAYEQWVALRLDNADPLKAVLRKQRNEMNQWYPHSWTDNDFTDVAAALERILKEAGWLRTSS
jgi:hypothetical protein